MPAVGLLLALFLALALFAAGYVYERVGQRRDARRNPPPGRMIPVGEHRLHLLCKGNGGHTVVIEQGAGELSRFWWPIQDETAEFARVCTYDRAGFGWSEASRGGRTIDDRVDELRTLLSEAGLEGPFILVAHSYGGLIVRRYLQQHPGEVAGLVLVDTPEESTLFRREVLDFYARLRVVNRAVGWMAKFGFLRFLRNWLPLDRYGFWLQRAEEYWALCDDLASLDLVPEPMRGSKGAGSAGSLPLFVITHGQAFPGPFAVLEKNWTEGQTKLAALSTDSVLMVAKNSNHMIQNDDPGLVVAAIRRVHTATRDGTPLRLLDDEAVGQDVLLGAGDGDQADRLQGSG